MPEVQEQINFYTSFSFLDWTGGVPLVLDRRGYWIRKNHRSQAKLHVYGFGANTGGDSSID